MATKIEVHLLTFNEAMILPYTLRHYRAFADLIVVHDGGSIDRTWRIAEKAGEGVLVQDYDSQGQLNDQINRELKNTCWLGTKADWVICADADELVYFPHGTEETLVEYHRHAIPVIRPYGFSMFSDVLPSKTGQIYDEIKTGAPDCWYAKPIIFTPHLVKTIDFAPGAHSCTAHLYDGTTYRTEVCDGVSTDPEVYLLHYHHLGPIEHLARLNDLKRTRLADINKACGWGSLADGIDQERVWRSTMLPRMEQVIP